MKTEAQKINNRAIAPKSKEKIEKPPELISDTSNVAEKNAPTKISSHNFSDKQTQESRKQNGE